MRNGVEESYLGLLSCSASLQGAKRYMEQNNTKIKRANKTKLGNVKLPKNLACNLKHKS